MTTDYLYEGCMPVEGVTTVVVFPMELNQYLHKGNQPKVRRKPRKHQIIRPEGKTWFKPSTFRQSALRAETFGHWWGSDSVGKLVEILIVLSNCNVVYLEPTLFRYFFCFQLAVECILHFYIFKQIFLYCVSIYMSETPGTSVVKRKHSS